jgi:hypothetical protein
MLIIFRLASFGIQVDGDVPDVMHAAIHHQSPPQPKVYREYNSLAKAADIVDILQIESRPAAEMHLTIGLLSRQPSGSVMVVMLVTLLEAFSFVFWDRGVR